LIYNGLRSILVHLCLTQRPIPHCQGRARPQGNSPFQVSAGSKPISIPCNQTPNATIVPQRLVQVGYIVRSTRYTVITPFAVLYSHILHGHGMYREHARGILSSQQQHNNNNVQVISPYSVVCSASPFRLVSVSMGRTGKQCSCAQPEICLRNPAFAHNTFLCPAVITLFGTPQCDGNGGKATPPADISFDLLKTTKKRRFSTQ
jgi:hypothetical protein